MPTASNHPVCPDAAGEVPDHLDGVVGVEVDDLGVLLQGHGQAGLDPVHGQDPPGALPLGGGDGELPDGTRAKDGDGVAVADLGQAGAEPSGGEDVRHQDGLVVAHLIREADQRGGRERNPRVLGLQAVHWPGALRPPKNEVPAFGPLGLATSHCA
jgi:hypothetical protein